MFVRPDIVVLDFHRRIKNPYNRSAVRFPAVSQAMMNDVIWEKDN